MTRGRTALGVQPWSPAGPTTRWIFASSRIRARAKARNAAFRILRSALSPLRGGSAILGVGEDDEHFVEPREIHHGLGLHLLVDAEIPLHDLGHLRDRDTLWKTAAVAARDQDVSLLHL